MYYIHKIISWMLSPLGMAVIGVGMAYLLNAYSRKSGFVKARLLSLISRVVLVATLLSTWLFSTRLASRMFALTLESDFGKTGVMHGDISSLPDADAIVVLGGGMDAHKECGAAEMFMSADRVWQGAKLYRAGKADVLTLSGSGVEESSVPLLSDFGVPLSAMRYFPEAKNTEDEARLISDAGFKRILLVTSAWHMKRAQLLFERAGLEVIPAPTDFELSCALESEFSLIDLVPTADDLLRNTYAFKEVVALALYRIFK